jgi:hypothetical protein
MVLLEGTNIKAACLIIISKIGVDINYYLSVKANKQRAYGNKKGPFIEVSVIIIVFWIHPTLY